MKKNLPKKLLSLLLSGMLVVTGLDMTAVHAAEQSASAETEFESTSRESQTAAETASRESQIESQSSEETASDQLQEAAESSTDELITATESASKESSDETASISEESSNETESVSEKSSTESESIIDETETEINTEIETELETELQTELETETETEIRTDSPQPELPDFSLFEVNPLYADLIDVSQTEEQFEGKALLAEPREEAACQTLEEAAAHLREKMTAREGTVVINMPASVLLGYTFETFFDAVFEAAYEYSDACSGQEGDALRWATKTRGIEGTSPDKENYHLVFTITYHSTAAQEEELTTAVDNALKELGLDGKSDYEKVRAIHDYICDHVNYDYSLTKYSAYDALCTGESVCQGYAVLFYRMCKDAGLSVRIISGKGNGGDHGWNIVKISDNARAAGQYYNVDCTWDGQTDKTHHSYFLKCDADFINHTRDDEYNTAEFLAAFPMTEASYVYSDSMNVPNINLRIHQYQGENVEDFWENYDSVYTSASGKPKIIALIQDTCVRSRETVREIANNDFGDVDLYVILAAPAGDDTIPKFKTFIDTYAPNSSHITFAFNTSTTPIQDSYIPGPMPPADATTPWDAYMDIAVEHLGWTQEEPTPVLVYIDASDKVQHMTTGRQTANAIKQNLQTFCSGEGGNGGTFAYTITYKLNGGTNHTGNPSAYTASSDPITLLDPVKEGYTFLGWYTDQEMTKKITQITSQNTGSLTLYAKWEANAQKPENPDGFPEIDMNLTDGNILVGLSGAYATETADTILERLNEIRLEACREGVINPATDQPLTEEDYTPLKWSSDLEAIARLRAAEAALRPAHDRPNGQKWSTVKTTNNEQSWAENLAWNYSDLMSGIEQWYKEKLDWVNNTGGQTGHYESIINTRYTYVAVSAFKLPEGYIYPVCVAQEFSDKASLDSQKNDFAGNCMQEIEIAGSAVSKLAFDSNSPLSLKTGSSHKLDLNATVGFEAFNGKTNCTGPVQDGAVWTSSDETIAAVDDKGQITTFKDGTVTITAAAGAISAELTVKVSANGDTPDEPEPPKTYTITYELNGGSNDPSNPDSYTSDTDTITLKAPVKEGCTFAGWYRDEALTLPITQIVKGSSGNLTLYAKWDDNTQDPEPPKTYTITYELNGGSNDPSNPDSYTSDTDTITLKAPVKEGCTFAGWYKDAAFTLPITSIDKGSSGNLTLYAKWDDNTQDPDNPPVAEFTVTFDTQGHGTAPQPYTGIQDGALIQKPADPAVQGYLFEGWYRDAACRTAWNFDTDKVTADLTLYAKWTAEPKPDETPDKDDTYYEDNHRTDLKDIGAAIADIKPAVYNAGKPYQPTVKVTIPDGKKKITLTEGADYRVSYKNNDKAGTATVIIRGNGIYKGELTKEYTISKKPLKKLSINTGGMAASAVNTGKLPISIYDGMQKLDEKDYTLSLDTVNKKKTAATVIISAAENSCYEGTAKATITLYTADADKIINPENVTLNKYETSYTGKAVNDVEPVVKLNDETLEKNKHYKVQYKNNTKAGENTALVIVTGKGQYKGKVIVPFTITASSTSLSINPITTAKTYNGKLQKPSLTVKAETKKLKANTDYTVKYSDNVHAGTATVTVTGIGNYAGSAPVTTTFTIKPQKISKASVKGTVSKGITLTYNKKPLVEGVDYTLTYGAVKKGKTQVTITGIGDFTEKYTKMIKN